MDDDAGTSARRRRRRRASDGASDAAPVPGPEIVPGPPATERAAARPPAGERGAPKQRRHRGPHDAAERGLRDLVGAGHSQVGVNGALRARDLNRPTEEDLAEAEQTIVVVRRHWQPSDGRK